MGPPLLDKNGQPIPDPKKDPTPDGSLVTIPAGGGTNWLPPSYDPKSGYFFVNAARGYSLAYLTDTDPRPEGYAGSGRNLWSQHVLEAVDTRTGEIAWPRDGNRFLAATRVRRPDQSPSTDGA